MTITIDFFKNRIKKYGRNYGENLRLTLALLSRSTRKRLFLLSLSQILLAILEVLALGILTLSISLGLNAFTNIGDDQSETSSFVAKVFPNLSVENRIGILLAVYVILTLTKTILSAAVTIRTLTLLATQGAEIGTKVNTSLFVQGQNLIRFGKSQENLSGVTGSIDSLLLGYLGALSHLLGDIATILMVCFALVFFDYKTAILLFILFSLLIIVLHKFINSVASKWSQESSVIASRLNRKILDSWLIYRELLLTQNFTNVSNPMHETRVNLARLRAKLNFLPSLSKYIFELFLIVSAIIVTCIQLWINGLSQAINSFALILAASARLLPAILRLQGNLLTTKQAIGGGYFAKQLLKKITLESDTAKSLDKIPNIRFPRDGFIASVEMKDVSFSFPDSNKNALVGVSLKIHQGNFIAITGASGSGNSTLVDLLLGFLKPTEGSVLINGTTPAIAREIWPGKMAYVPQDVQIIEGSILENITLSSSENYDQLNLELCIKSAGLQEDLGLLSEGIHTFIGERGMKLSGGQKQRVGIARALYTNPKLIVFDEATSALDPITERLISESLYHGDESRTIVVVAHRLSTVISADQIIYLKSGRVVASGKFEELRRSEPEFLKQVELSGL